jgi:hypothetical protein
MYTAYLLIFTAFSGAGEIIDPKPHVSLSSCEAELSVMKDVVEREWAVHGIIRMKGDCRSTDSLKNALVTGEEPRLSSFN